MRAIRNPSQFRGPREFLKATRDAVFEVDPDGHIVRLNRTTEKLFGYPRRELLGHPPRILIPEHFPADCGDRDGECGPLTKPGRGSAPEGRRKDGSRFPIELSLSPINSRKGAGAIAIIRDASEGKRAEGRFRAVPPKHIGELRALAGRVESARENEKRRIARELHDELGQGLTAIKLEVRRLTQAVSKEREDWFEASRALEHLIDQTILSVRRIVSELRPQVLDDLGLTAAVEWAGEEFQIRTGTRCRLHLSESARDVEPEQATALFRILQESLTNVARHAHANQVDVWLDKRSETLTLKIHDDGKGVTTQELSGNRSLGILGMKERALLLGGQLSIRGIPGRGTTIEVRIPAAGAAEGRRSQ